MAHGQDVANLGRIPGVTAATRWVLRRSAGGDRQLALARRAARPSGFPQAEAKIEIADCGVDLDAFSPRPAAEARGELGWDGEGPAFLCVGSLIERKNVVRLADAFASLGPRPTRLRRRRPAADRARGAAGRARSSGASRRPRCRTGSPPATCSASPRCSSRSGRRRSRRWRWSAASSRPGRRAPGVRHPGGRRPGRPRGRRGPACGAGERGRAAVAEPSRPRGRRGARRQARRPEWPRCSSGFRNLDEWPLSLRRKRER